MCICKYCNIQFTPRPQVKNPQACKNNLCQIKRQRSNEKNWKKLNINFYDRLYYSAQKTKRINLIKEKAQKLLKSFTTGLLFEGIFLNNSLLTQLWDQFFIRLGIRIINKLWVTNTSL